MSNSVNGVFGLFNDSFPPVLDGVTLTVVNYARGLIEAGFPVSVVTPWNPVTPTLDGMDLMRYFSLPIWNRRPYRYGYPRLDPSIWIRLRQRPFKLVHAHCPFSSGRLAAYCSRRNGIPLVATFHSKYKTDLEHSLPEWIVKIIMKRIINFYESADEVWIPQAAVEETMREYGYRGNVTVVDNGNDLSDYDVNEIIEFKTASRRRLGWNDNVLGLLFVGQHIKEKGVETIINALSGLPTDVDWRMNFIGTGYNVENMGKMVKNYGLESRVTFHGVVSDREHLKLYYAASDLFLFPSMYDNAPLVVREAAAMCTPSILPSGSTASEVIHDGMNGFLCENRADAYRDTIVRLNLHRKDITSAGLNAKISLGRSWRDIIDEVIIRYQEIIERYDFKHKK